MVQNCNYKINFGHNIEENTMNDPWLGAAQWWGRMNGERIRLATFSWERWGGKVYPGNRGYLLEPEDDDEWE